MLELSKIKSSIIGCFLVVKFVSKFCLVLLRLVIFVLIIHKTWIPHEEVKLKEKFGKDWEKYAASTSRWLG